MGVLVEMRRVGRVGMGVEQVMEGGIGRVEVRDIELLRLTHQLGGLRNWELILMNRYLLLEREYPLCLLVLLLSNTLEYPTCHGLFHTGYYIKG